MNLPARNIPAPPERGLTPDAALDRLLAAAYTLTGTQQVPLRDALGRVLAAPVASPVDVPGHRNSAMDGYAIRHADTAGEGRLRVIGTALAGKPFTGTVGPGEAVRIMTGAVLPGGADTVVMQEQAHGDGEWVNVTGRIEPGDHVRHPGEDLRRGEPVLHTGALIGAAELGLLASLGVPEVRVQRRLRVAFFSTGDELRSVGEPLGEGEIYDSNRYTLFGLLTELGVAVLDMGVVRDRPDALEAAFLEAADCADVVITSGGVSVGEADFVKQVLEQVGRIAFWRILMKPGKPLAFGHIGEALFFGLPGNPVSVMVGFYQFVLPVLKRLQGREAVRPLTLEVPCASRLKKRRGRMEFQRGVLFVDEDGRHGVRSTGAQGSGILRSMHEANCFIVLPEESEGVEPGERVTVQPFCGFGGRGTSGRAG